MIKSARTYDKEFKLNAVKLYLENKGTRGIEKVPDDLGVPPATLYSWINFRFGSVELFAQRAQARALLINIGSFSTVVMVCGALFGGLLHYLDWNPMLVFGGILMPLNVSLGLITGGLIARFTQHQEQWFPFWSGVFAAQSLWIAISALWQISYNFWP